jgi:hypothetical protein
MFIKIICECEWIPVKSEHGEPYKFPDDITKFMMDNYTMPAVYRWVIDGEMYYVGESKDLCRRIKAYLRAPKPKFNENGKMLPHQQTTNIKMHEKLQASRNCIEFLKFDRLQFGDATYTYNDLKNHHIRLLVEKMATCGETSKIVEPRSWFNR